MDIKYAAAATFDSAKDLYDAAGKVREKGYKVLFQPNSIIYHKLSHSNSGSHIYAEHNKKYFFNK